MSRFYSMLRAQMMKAQIEQDAGVLRELIQLLFSVREAWVELNSRLAAPPAATEAQLVEAQTGRLRSDCGTIQVLGRTLLPARF